MSNGNAGMKNTSLRDLLSSIQPKMKKTLRKGIFSPHPIDPNTLGEDGVDHINIGPYSNTEIGKALANEIPIPVDHKIFGKFRCITGFWYYIKSRERDDRCRKLIGRSLKDFSKELSLSEVKNFRAIILDTVWAKVQQHEAIKDGLVDATLPFDCYFENKGTQLRQRPNYFAWFLEGISEIRNALLEDREPSFSKFLDDRASDIYDFVLPERIVRPMDDASEEDRSGVSTDTNDEIRRLIQGVLVSEPVEELFPVVAEEAPVEEVSYAVQLEEALVEVQEDVTEEAVVSEDYSSIRI